MPGNDLSAALARTLAALRAERGWSLDQLAARSGVSKGVLVSLEQARSNPNLATLARVGDAFGLPVTRLLDGPPGPSVRITGPEYARTLWHGTTGGSGTIIAATEPPWAAELWRWEVLPGRVVRRGRACARDQGACLGRGGHPDADRGRGTAPGRPRPVCPLPRKPAALLRQRGHRAGPPHHDRGRAAGPGVTASRPAGPHDGPGRATARRALGARRAVAADRPRRADQPARSGS